MIEKIVFKPVDRLSRFVQVIISMFMDGFQNDFAQFFSVMSRCASLRFHLGQSKVKVMWASRVVPGQPSSWKSSNCWLLVIFFNTQSLLLLPHNKIFCLSVMKALIEENLHMV